jgi:hypothetical protein
LPSAGIPGKRPVRIILGSITDADISPIAFAPMIYCEESLPGAVIVEPLGGSVG